MTRTFVLAIVIAFSTANAQQRINRGSAPSPAPGTVFMVPERVPTRDGRLVEGERGLVFVPMLHGDPSRGVLAVEVWRFRALQPTKAAPVFRLPGGPGHDGLHVNLAGQGYYERNILPTRQFADYVIVGQRGMYTSPPNTMCEPGEDFVRQCRAYWEAAGIDRRAFTVIEAAHDVADVARALGYDSIVVRGGSFGSHWTLALMRLHPKLVARALLNGTEGPDHEYDLPSQLLAALHRIARSAESSPEFGGLVPPGGIAAALDTVIARLRVAPITARWNDSTGTAREYAITKELVPSFARGHSASADTRNGARSWPADMLRLFYGDYAPLGRYLERRIGRPGDARPAPRWPYSYGISAIDLLECASGGSAKRLEQLERDPAVALLGTLTYRIEMCREWDADIGDQYRGNFDTQIPTVVVHGTWDLSTPYENALDLMPHLKHGKLVTVLEGSHGALAEAQAEDRPFADAIEAFLRTGSTAALTDTVRLAKLAWTVPADLRELAARKR